MDNDANQTQIITKDGTVMKESSIFGVSIRGWVVYLFAFTVCVNQLLATTAAVWLSILNKDAQNLGSASAITEPLYGLAYMAVGYYFAKNSMPKMEVK